MNYAIFKTKAQARHGEKYSYPTWSEDKLSKDRVVVVCPVHGEFLQIVNNHLNNGTGCSKCTRRPPPLATPTSLSDIIKRIAGVHGDKYIYPRLAEEYTSIRETWITIVCPEHGEFKQRLSLHLSGSGCRKCATARRAKTQATSPKQFLKRAAEIHDAGYQYPLLATQLKNASSKISAVCPKHGEFVTTPRAHLNHKSGCPRCGDEQTSQKLMTPFLEVIRLAKLKHENFYQYELDQPSYQGRNTPLNIICPKHGMFQQRAGLHTAGSGCPSCAGERRAESMTDPLSCVISKAKVIHGGLYTYPVDQPEYRNQHSPIRVVCPTHGEFEQMAYNHLSGEGCPRCTKIISSGEASLREFVESLGIATTRGRGKAIPGLGHHEFDIIVKSQNIGIEFHGLYWHSEASPGPQDRNRHLNKLQLAESLGYRLVQVFEDEWLNKRALVESRLRAILGVPSERLFARKTQVKEITWGSAKQFLESTHIQGSGPAPTASVGLEAEGRLVAVATFGKPRFSKSDDWELLRFSSVGQVVGGASKLVAYFKSTYGQPGQTVISYADRRWGKGGLYPAIGFAFDGYSPPGYAYVKAGKRYNRMMFQKHKLSKLLITFDPRLSERENCANAGYYRVFDCGTSRWRLTL